MANLLPFFPSAAFDHNATRAMGKAFDRACHSLHDIGQPDLEQIPVEFTHNLRA